MQAPALRHGEHAAHRKDSSEKTDIEKNPPHHKPPRGSHEHIAIDAILDEALVCHITLAITQAQANKSSTTFIHIGNNVYVTARGNGMLSALRQRRHTRPDHRRDTPRCTRHGAHRIPSLG